MIKQSFTPILPLNPKILILGSLPGDISIAQHQYYGHPNNRFWKILFHIYQEEFTSDYRSKIDFLHRHHIALWDVCATAHRPGSMDIHISEVIPNPIPTLLAKNPTIHSIYFNGQKAQQLYDKNFKPINTIHYQMLPSSSPANAQFSFQKLVELWEIILK
ncbi:DNA-deoxyinosine glycosylase [Sphingobacterium rhinopitheci]|uniref:DNA-deoxyinosine glycosylase n=1 Tax=Sphingobacterium rhinopitheci TaxID=2781960 RepID=UPI001F51E724|nr:DNA-deoxyinosine glycosylase [Sphingobacterium rhinopitheci]MCI0920033.1 DNA-deoxyinosine glycosylase [Sphingobacterium rhinopitheci]